MRYLITGIAGFAGTHLAELLLEGGNEVCGQARRGELSPALLAVARRYPELPSRIAAADVRQATAVSEVVRRFEPDGIFHLAGQSFVGGGDEDAADTFAANTLGALNVIAAARRVGKGCRILLVGSGESYGRSAGPEAVGEAAALRPVTVYGASKAAAEILARQAFETHGANIVCARAFNHTGPGQSPRFVCADFARQIAEAEAERRSAVRVGSLDAVRDFLDVRDVVRAYVRLWKGGEAGGVYNVASGVGRRIGEVLDSLRQRARTTVAVEFEPSRLRPAEVPVLVGDSTRLRALGWRPERKWEDTLDDVMEDWRRRTASVAPA